jgi:hypothetical protein
MFSAPDSGEEFFAGENAARVGSELIEEAEFEEAGGDAFLGAADVAGVEVDGKFVELQDLAELGVGRGAPKEKVDAGDQFAWAEGLGDEIVSPGFEGGDEVGFAATGG